MIKKGYYAGCSASGTSKEYDMSTRKVYEALGFELEELEDWVCCGSSPAHSTSLLLGDALALKNLSLAKKQGLKELIIPCMECYTRFLSAQHDLKNDPVQRKKAEEATGIEYDEDIRKIEIIHPLTHLNDNIDLIREKLRKKANDLKAVCYYGCVFTRPPEITGYADFEDPKEMDNLLEAVGVDVLDWNSKTKCCGAAYTITNKEIAFELCNRILTRAKDAGAQLIVTACPLCQGNLDMRQRQIEQKFNHKFNIPVIYITQILGVALGATYDQVGLDKEFVPVKKLMEDKGLV